MMLLNARWIPDSKPPDIFIIVYSFSFLLFQVANNETKTRRQYRENEPSGSQNKVSASVKSAKFFSSAMKRWSTYQTEFQIYHTQIHDAHKKYKNRIFAIEFYIFLLARCWGWNFMGLGAQDLTYHAAEDCFRIRVLLRI